RDDVDGLQHPRPVQRRAELAPADQPVRHRDFQEVVNPPAGVGGQAVNRCDLHTVPDYRLCPVRLPSGMYLTGGAMLSIIAISSFDGIQSQAAAFARTCSG